MSRYWEVCGSYSSPVTLWDTKSLSKFWRVQKSHKSYTLSYKPYSFFLLLDSKRPVLSIVGLSFVFLWRQKDLRDWVNALYEGAAYLIWRWYSFRVVLAFATEIESWFVSDCFACGLPFCHIIFLREIGLNMSCFFGESQVLWKHLLVAWLPRSSEKTCSICLRTLSPLRMSISRVGGSSKCQRLWRAFQCQWIARLDIRDRLI